jgi:hypothetical protein
MLGMKHIYTFLCLFLLSGVAYASSIYGKWEFIDDQPVYFGEDHPSSKLHGKQLSITDDGIKLPDGTACQFLSSKTVNGGGSPPNFPFFLLCKKIMAKINVAIGQCIQGLTNKTAIAKTIRIKIS